MQIVVYVESNMKAEQITKTVAFKQQGVGLIEVMVAMFLLGVAVIGFSSLQIRALGTTNEAMFRTQAMSIAQELGERIRLNPNGLNTYKNGWAAATTAMSNYKCETTNCTETEMAQYDLKTMTELVEQVLPNGKIKVLPCIERTNFCVYVAWNRTNASNGTDDNPNDGAMDCSSSVDDTYHASSNCVRLEGAL